MARLTPPIGTKGSYLLREPFVAPTTTSYRCAAIRTIEEMISQGDKPFDMVYLPRELTNAEYQADIKAGALIVTLLADGKDPIYVPDTYIDSYPNMAAIPHSRIVAVVSLGLLPDTYDTVIVENAIKQSVSDYTGVESTVTIAKAPVSDAISQEQYLQNLAARQAAIQNRNSDYADKLALQQRVSDMQDEINTLTAIIEQLGGTTPAGP